MTTFSTLKAPGDIMTLPIDWSDTLEGFSPNDTISTSTWSVVSGDVAIDADSNTTSTATAVISAGTNYTYAIVTNRIVTAAALQFDRSVVLSIQTR